MPDNAGWAFAVRVVFQDLFNGAFFSGTLVTVFISCYAIFHWCGSAIVSRAVWRQEEPLESTDFLSAVGLRSPLLLRFSVVANDCRTGQIEQLPSALKRPLGRQTGRTW